jgi:hypothetical protein
MLPGFRFLFAAIVLSMSVLVFGLGAAAVLRAAHEQFAESGSWRPAPDTSVAQQSEMSRPVLAMLRVDPPSKAADAAPVTPSAQPADIAPSPELEQTAVPDSQAASAPETAKADTPEVAKVEVAKAEVAPEAPRAEDKATPAAAIAPVPQEPARQELPAAQPAVEAPASTDTKTAAVDPVPPAAPAPAAAPAIRTPPAIDAPAAVSTSEAFPAAPEQPSAPAAADPAATRIATLGGPPVLIEQPAIAKAVGAGPNPSDVTKQQEKERAEERARRRRLAARRAKEAEQAAQAQQAANPFGQINPTPPFLQPGQANASARTR